MGDLRRLEKCVLGVFGVPQVALEIDDSACRDRGLVDVAGMQILRGTQIGVHGALAVGRDQNVTPAGRWTTGGRFGIESNAGGPDVVGKGAPKPVVLDLADERRPRAE